MKYVFTFCCLLVAVCGSAQKPQNEFSLLNQQADSLYRKGDYLQSAMTFEKIIEQFPGRANSDIHYNAACTWALAGNKKMAFKNLFIASGKYGYANFSHIGIDSDLVSLHKDKRWRKFEKDVRNNYTGSYNVKLQEQLDQMFADDQKPRNRRDSVVKYYGMNSKEYAAVINEINEMDSVNDKKLCSIFDKYGWPGPNSPNGEKIERISDFYLYTILQHSSLATQLKYLPLLKDAVTRRNARGKDFAYVQDRILQRQGKRQLYGSQLSVDKNNKPFVWPIRDIDNLDKRRVELGMQTMKADLKLLFNLDWNPDEYKKQLPDLEKNVNIKE